MTMHSSIYWAVWAIKGEEGNQLNSLKDPCEYNEIDTLWLIHKLILQFLCRSLFTYTVIHCIQRIWSRLINHTPGMVRLKITNFGVQMTKHAFDPTTAIYFFFRRSLLALFLDVQIKNFSPSFKVKDPTSSKLIQFAFQTGIFCSCCTFTHVICMRIIWTNSLMLCCGDMMVDFSTNDFVSFLKIGRIICIDYFTPVKISSSQ